MKKTLITLMSIFILVPVAFAQERGRTREGREVAARMERAREVYERSGNERGAREAREAADRAREARSAREARQVERDFNKGNRF